MNDARAPDKELIKQEYLKGIKQKDICEKYNLSLNTLKSWIKRYGWSKEKKGAPKPQKECIPKKVKKTSKRADSSWNKESYPTMKRPNNKNAISTGEFESIFFDTLEDDEIKLVDSIEIEKRNLLIHEIQLLTVRERRMLKRIADLKNKEITLKSYKTGIEKDADTDLKEFETALNQIQNIEEALTRVQEKKQKAIDLLHKFDVDEAKLDIAVMKTELAILKQGGDEGPVEDDGFIDALNAQVDEVWNDD